MTALTGNNIVQVLVLEEEAATAISKVEFVEEEKNGGLRGRIDAAEADVVQLEKENEEQVHRSCTACDCCSHQTPARLDLDRFSHVAASLFVRESNETDTSDGLVVDCSMSYRGSLQSAGWKEWCYQLPA